jgi:hypothetical protein
MCASYWNVKATLLCPACGKEDKWELQTHFMGYMGSCQHEYTLGKEVDELEGVTVLLDGRIADFSGSCPKCDARFDVGANIVAGKIEKLFIIRQVEVAA